MKADLLDNLKKTIGAHYRSGVNNLGLDFFKPCLENCISYKRASGFFTSNVLKTWALALPSIVESGNTIIKLIISPQISNDDLKILSSSSDPSVIDNCKRVTSDKIILDILKYAESPSTVESDRLKILVFCWLIANEKLKIRFAFTADVLNHGIFHEKIGVFDFGNNLKIAFTGSANETEFGHISNYESIDVYRSWNQHDVERVIVKEEQFDEAWNSKAPGLDVFDISPEILNKVKSTADKYTVKRNKISIDEAKCDHKWKHQNDALNAFLAVKSGVLEMATGTGKTRTAIKIIEQLYKQKLITSVIVTTDGNDLLEQWSKEVNALAVEIKCSLRVYRQYEGYHDLYNFVLHPCNAIIIISRLALHNLLSILKPSDMKNTFIVHDEVHGLGSPSNIEKLAGKHIDFCYKLGLSATPEREYDSIGTDFINNEIGPVFFKFELKDAIRKGILCEFKYIPLPYELTDNDKSRIQAVYLKKANRARIGNPMSDKEVWTDIAKVYKTAELKPLVFTEFINLNPKYLDSCIIFVETMEYGDQLLKTIHLHTHLYKTYYADAEQYHLLDFSKGDLDCLITCHRLSQGIDIQRLKTVILFSSAKSKLETIQRIGRCLRIDPHEPDKCANVIDFVRNNEVGSEKDNADIERFKWLSDLSNTRRDSSCH